jgi:uncharacterized membrane protein (DUF106 family)
VAPISSNSSVLVAIVALVLNYRGFTSLDNRMLRLEQRMDGFQHDLMEFYKAQNEFDKRISKLEDKQ